MGSRLMSYETETLHNLDAIKGFGITGRYGPGFRNRQEEFRRASLDYNLFSIRTEILLSLLGSAVQMAAFGYCLYLLWSGKILYGTMTLFLSQGAKLSSAFNASGADGAVVPQRVGVRPPYPGPVRPGAGAGAAGRRAGPAGIPGLHRGRGGRGLRLCAPSAGADLCGFPGRARGDRGLWWVPSGGGKTTMIRLLLGLIRPRRAAHISRLPTGGRWR